MVDLLGSLLLVGVEQPSNCGRHHKHYTIVIIQCKFYKYFSIYFSSLLYRNDELPIEPFDDSSATPAALGISTLYNSMIYPFTRTVIYGAIWYQGKE
jgi:hypothetical protein